MSLVRCNSKIITFTPAAASFATPYSSGDVIGAVTKLSLAVLDFHGTAILESIIALDKANQKSAIDLIFFDSNPANSVGADNAAYGLNDADLSKLLGRVSIAAADYVSSGTNNAEATKTALGLLLQASVKTKDLWVLAISRGTPTYGSASDLSFRIGLLQD